MTTRTEIQKWFKTGASNGYRWMIIVCDQYDHSDYPVFVKTVADFDNEYANHDSKNMQKIMEVYDLSKDAASQLKSDRAWNYPTLSHFNPLNKYVPRCCKAG